MFRKIRILIGLLGVWSLHLFSSSGDARAQNMILSEPETWMGHTGAVTALAFSPDGQVFVSGGADHLIKLWDSEQRVDRGAFRGHEGTVWGLDWSSDGKALVSASEDRTIRIWTPGDRQESKRLTLSAPVFSVAVSPDRLWLAAGSGDKAVQTWSFRQLKRANPVPEQTDLLGQARFIPGDNILAVPTASRSILLWDPYTKEPVGELRGGASPIAVSADGRWLASGSGADDAILLWDMSQRTVVATFPAHLNMVTSLHFSSDGLWLASSSLDQTIRIWDVERRRLMLTRDEERPVWAVAFSPDGRALIAGEEEGLLRKWHIQIGLETVATDPGPAVTPSPVFSRRGGDVNKAPISKIQRPDALGIILGVETYRYAPEVTFARNDARSMRDYFVKTLGIPASRIYLRMDQEATQGEFRKIFDPAQGWLAKRIKPGSTEIFVYYVGHGAPDISTGDTYLMPSDSDPNYPATSYRLAEMYRSLEQLPVQQATVFLDACFSGRVGRGRQVEMLLAGARGIGVQPRQAHIGDNTMVLTASAGNQLSSSYPAKAHGLFTYFLMLGLQGEADVDNNRTITLQELYTYVRQRVGTEAGLLDREQTPELFGNALGRTLVTY